MKPLKCVALHPNGVQKKEKLVLAGVKVTFIATEMARGMV